MTAEIAVMNNVGVALAADSAVTWGSKIYASADKLFQLSSGAPIGVMFYGNADFVALPWETIIKTYRKALSTRTFGTVAQYSDSFLAFLKKNTRLFPQSAQDSSVIESVRREFEGIIGAIERRLTQGTTPPTKITPRTIRAAAAAVADSRLNHIRKLHPRHTGLSARSAVAVLRRYKAEVVKCRDDVFGTLPLDGATKRSLLTLAAESLIRVGTSEFDTGIVVAGFGERQYNPALVETAIEGMVLGVPAATRKQHARISHLNRASVIPFAQREMVHTFMEGVDEYLLEMMQASTGQLFSDVLGALIGEVGNRHRRMAKALRKQMEPKLIELLRNLLNEWGSVRSRHYVHPIMHAVSVLPKDELGAMAEALVNITKFKRRVSEDQETVGGPIDVAVITKGDGFVWMKRKHYFDPGLNPRAIHRLQGRA